MGRGNVEKNHNCSENCAIELKFLSRIALIEFKSSVIFEYIPPHKTPPNGGMNNEKKS